VGNQASSRRVSRFFGCSPMNPLSGLVVVGWAVARTAGAEVVPVLVDRVHGRLADG